MTRLRVTWLCLSLIVFVLSSASADASTNRRYAIVVGANKGHSDEVPLLYAERDARKIADVLTTFAGVRPENLVLLQGTTNEELSRAFWSVTKRIRSEAVSENVEATMIFYYSGHADGDGLHMSGTTFGFGDLRKYIKNVPGRARVVVVDACHSGDITRSKGGKPVKPFEIAANDQLHGEGMAIITSSASGEDSQESERLSGGIFTHHFVNGLQGAADISGDARVTLTEVYRYAYQQTLRATSKAAALQHPSYQFDLRGHDDFVLTWLTNVRGRGSLVLKDVGEYLVFDEGGEKSLVAEVSVDAGSELVLSEGVYLVRRRDPHEVRQGRVTILDGQNTVLRQGDMTTVPYGTTVRRGYQPELRSAVSLLVESGVGRTMISTSTVATSSAIGVHLDFRSFSVMARVAHGYETGRNDTLALRQNRLGFDVAAFKMIDLGRFSPGIGLRGGGDWIHQSFSSHGIAPSRSSFALRGGPALLLSFGLAKRTSLFVQGAADTSLYSGFDVDVQRSSLRSRFLPSATTGIAIQLN